MMEFPRSTYLVALISLCALSLGAAPPVLPDILTAVSPGQTNLRTLPSQLANAASILNLTALTSSTSGCTLISTSLTSFNSTTNPILSPLTSRPPDPSEFEIPSTSLTLKFSAYTANIPLSNVLTVLIQTLLVSIDKIVQAGGDVPFGIDTEFHYQHAFFIVYAGDRKGPEMTYDVLASVVKGIVGFAQQYGSFGSRIFVEDSGVGEIGGCLLSYV